MTATYQRRRRLPRPFKECDCGQVIVFLKTKHGNLMPVDYDERMGTLPHATDIFDAKKHSSHKDTCPQRSRFRKNRVEDPEGF